MIFRKHEIKPHDMFTYENLHFSYVEQNTEERPNKFWVVYLKK